jgi:hypothetical protein
MLLKNRGQTPVFLDELGQEFGWQRLAEIIALHLVAALQAQERQLDYWYRIKQREKISGLERSTSCRQFKLEAPDGSLRETDCSLTEGLLRIVQSILCQGSTLQTLAGEGGLRANGKIVV